MCATGDIRQKVLASAKRQMLFLPHAVQQMSRPDRMISTTDVRQVINGADVIEDYPNDPRGHSCLLLGHGKGNRPIHVVCAPKDEFLAIITAYLPNPTEWDAAFRVRRES